MRSHSISAPAYLGESCLWVPFSDWSKPPERCSYNAICERRSIFVMLSQSALMAVLEEISPWLPERLAFFQKEVLKSRPAREDHFERCSVEGCKS
jgi:hypothetical protein